MLKDKKILVIGTGAIGGICAALIAKAGYQIEVICKYPELVQKITNEGLKISGIYGDMQVKMPAFACISELKEMKDIVLLATKATDMMDAAKELLPFLHENSLVISLQNGICEEMLAEVLGKNRVIGCVVGWGATMHAPGELEMTSTGEFVIGNIDNSPKERLKEVQELLSLVVPVEISADIIASLYSKLIINSCITSLGAICGLYLGEMLSKKKLRSLFIEIMREAIAVADAMKMKVPSYANKINYYKFLKNAGFLGNLYRHLLIRFIGFKYRRLKSSMLQSLERGNKTEVDFLNGFIVRKGLDFSVQTPVNSKVVKMIKEIEQGKRKIGIKNFDEF
jgi:2-dehydropantoate 2-reductase